jgi:hypothetical protein
MTAVLFVFLRHLYAVIEGMPCTLSWFGVLMP